MSENEKKDKTARDIMNLDEAIQHCKEQVQEQAKKGCYSCASEHQQLAEWLKELKAYRNKSEIPTSCGDAISRQAVLNAMYELCDTGETLKENPWRDNPHIDGVVEAIEELPSVTPQQMTGRWIEVIDESDSLGNKTWHHECSICGSDKSGWGTYKHCPDCGTRMEVEE